MPWRSKLSITNTSSVFMSKLLTLYHNWDCAYALEVQVVTIHAHLNQITLPQHRKRMHTSFRGLGCSSLFSQTSFLRIEYADPVSIRKSTLRQLMLMGRRYELPEEMVMMADGMPPFPPSSMGPTMPGAFRFLTLPAPCAHFLAKCPC